MQQKCFSQTITVTEDQTAEKSGSGLLPVFSTPAMIALMENTAMQMIEADASQSSVGMLINVKHLKASPVGATIHCKSTITAIEGRKYTFSIEVTDSSGELIGEGIHERFVIDIEKFMQKVNQQAKGIK